MSDVTLKDVTKVFGRSVVAVDHLNLDIRDGEFIILLGPSGCGKTTTLFLIAGLEELTDGEICFDQNPVHDLPPNQRDIAMVFQSYALYPHMSVFDNMAFGLKMHQVPRHDIEKRVRSTAEILGIADVLHRRPAQLSGGQRQRVALGRAIVREPEAFLLDEPLSNVDAKLRAQMRLELKALHRRLGTTFIYVTHDQIEAMSMGDRIAIMKSGQLQQYGTPDEVYNKPLNTFVAEFIGSPTMNFFEGTLTYQDGRPTFIGKTLRYTFTDRKTFEDPGDVDAVILGIRPEDVEVDLEQHEPHAFETEVQLEEPLGADTYLALRIGQEVMIARVDPGLKVRPGDKAWVTFTETKMHLFDKHSQKRLQEKQ